MICLFVSIYIAMILISARLFYIMMMNKMEWKWLSDFNTSPPYNHEEDIRFFSITISLLWPFAWSMFLIVTLLMVIYHIAFIGVEK